MSSTVQSTSAANASNFENAAQLSVQGNKIDTGRYEITVNEDEVVILDTFTGTKSRAWGDPHFHTGDGDKMAFHDENLTLDLADGTKLTLKVTGKNEDGFSFIDSLAVTKGQDAVVAKGIHDGKEGVFMSNVNQNAVAVDKAFEDGTVLSVGKEADDWFNADGIEIVGDDPSAVHGEILLDGMGGKSMNSAEDIVAQSEECLKACESGASSLEGISIDALLMKLAAQLGEKLQEKAEQLRGKIEQLNSGEAGSPETKALEYEIQADMADLQSFRQLLSQITTAATNISKSDHDAKMSIINNQRV